MTLDQVIALAHTAADSALKSDVLYAADWTQLGGGHFSTVYGHANADQVIKICSANEHDGWLDYALTIMNTPALQRNKYAPRIHAVIMTASHTYIAVMDKLSTTLMASRRTNGVSKGDALSSAIREFACTGFLRKKEIEEKLARKIRWEPEYAVFEGDKDFIEYVYHFVMNFAGSKKRTQYLDIHSENVMLDFNDQPVVTDPMSWPIACRATARRKTWLAQLALNNEAYRATMKQAA